MKFLIIPLAFIFISKISIAGSFVDSLAKEYGKKNGCYSISLKDKKNYNKSSKSNYNKKQLEKTKSN